MHSTSVQVDAATHRELKKLATFLGASIGDTVALAVRRMRQERIGNELAEELTSAENTWLDHEDS